jgi:hypothetical protein
VRGFLDFGGIAKPAIAAVTVILGGLFGPVAQADIIGTPVSGPRPTLNFYGTAGLIDMPSAEVMPDGEFSTTISHFGGITRNTLSFQISPRLSGSFRYSATEGLNLAGFETYFDRSFDLRYQLLQQQEGGWWPSVAIGLQDSWAPGSTRANTLSPAGHSGIRLP